MRTAPLSTQLQRVAPFFIGTVAKWPEVTRESAYSRTALSQFSSLTPEKIFKAAFLRPGPQEYFWQDADAFVSFCERKGKRLHGHTLVWDRELPSWLAGHSFQEHLLRNHVRNIVNRYKRRVQAWDVVNEAFTEKGSLREGTWHSIGGENYIGQAFTCAAEADPAALLFYNDFDLEVNAVKRRGMLEHLNALRGKGIKIDGIGLQLHLNISTARPAELKQALMDIAAHGYQIHLSELDISVNPYDGIVSGLEELLSQQADLLTQVMAYYMDVPAAQRHGVTFWGVGDADSWLTLDLKQVDYPLLFDEHYQPKPCYHSLLKLFEQTN